MYAIFCVLRGNATYFLNCYYSGPSVSVGFTSSDSTNVRTNIFGKKFQKVLKSRTLISTIL